MDRNVLRDKIKAKIAEKTAGRGKALLAQVRGRQVVSDEVMKARTEQWMASRTGQRVQAADKRREQRRGQRVYNEQQRRKAQREFTAHNMLRATQGEFDHISPHIGANVRTALQNIERAQQRKPKRARPAGVSKREYARRAKQSVDA